MCNIYVKYVTLRRAGSNHPPRQSDMQADYYIIKTERFNQGLNQLDLAKKAKISLSTVIKAERGGSISAKSNKAIRDALGLK